MSSHYHQIMCAAVAAVSAWNVLVITLEINEFKHRLQKSLKWNGASDDLPTTPTSTTEFDDDNITPPLFDRYAPMISESSSSSVSYSSPSSPFPFTQNNRLLAAHTAIRLGLRDALLDWFLLYSTSYGIVAGFTWKDADPNSLLVLWGLSVIVSAGLFFVLAGKVPQWLGYYHKSRFQIIADTSTLAKLTVDNESITIPSFRYQVRLAVGMHFSKFFFILLPFYVGLKVSGYLLSMLIGTVFGYLYLFVVFKCRQRFKRNRAKVAMGSSFFLYIISALIFQKGVYVANEAWQWNFANSRGALFAASFLGWLAFCLLFQIASYYEQVRFWKKEDDQMEPHLFIDSMQSDGNDDIDESGLETLFEEDDDEGGDGQVGDGEGGLEESFLSSVEPDEGRHTISGRRTRMKKMKMSQTSQAVSSSSSSYFYQTGYFDPQSVHATILSEGVSGSDESTSPIEIYNTFAAMEQTSESIKWYNRLWDFLPFKSAWKIYAMTCREMCGCGCHKDSGFHQHSIMSKICIGLLQTFGIVLNLLAIYVALVACVATTQITSTKALLPAVNEAVYKYMDDGPVCAFDEKDGIIREFNDKDEARDANFTIAHCGECGFCSNWNDLELEYSTRNTLAASAQKCGVKTLGQGVTALQDCLAGPTIGWTPDCARCWAEDIVCTKKHCMFIYLQSRMTNQVGNFKVSEDSITSATCEEAFCEAGPSGYFVPCVGANRRRMNITSDIQRPGTQRCSIVGVQWEDFFRPQV